MMRALAHGATPLVLAAGLACSATPADPIEELRDELEAAAEARDADRFGERLSHAFEGLGGMTREAGLGDLRRYFAAYESVALEIYAVEVARDGARADVRCVVEFAGRACALGGLRGLLPPAAVYRFELGLADEAGVWRVERASWEPVRPPAVSGS
jgi:hypothetical protein